MTLLSALGCWHAPSLDGCGCFHILQGADFLWSQHSRSVLMQTLANGAPRWAPAAARRTGTYVGCMFTDYMPLLRQGYGLHHSGAVMTGQDTAQIV